MLRNRQCTYHHVPKAGKFLDWLNYSASTVLMELHRCVRSVHGAGIFSLRMLLLTPSANNVKQAAWLCRKVQGWTEGSLHLLDHHHHHHHHHHLLLLLLLLLQSFDWLAVFHLELLQAILFIAV